MNSLPPLSEQAVRAQAHFAADAGLPYAPQRSADPIQAWLDLMEVVEALCERWPERQPSRGRDYRL